MIVVATFKPKSALAGKHIYFDDGRFALEGAGPLSADDVLKYDRKRQIIWESEQARARVRIEARVAKSQTDSAADHSQAPITCPSCGAPVTGVGAFCGSCGASHQPQQQMGVCPTCGWVAAGGEAFCTNCGTEVVKTTPPTTGTWAAPTPSPPPLSTQGAPGIGVAGFVLSLLGFTIIGIILSWIGFAQAQREDRPSGLCLAGIVVGFVWIAVGVVFYLAVYSASGA